MSDKHLRQVTHNVNVAHNTTNLTVRRGQKNLSLKHQTRNIEVANPKNAVKVNQNRLDLSVKRVIRNVAVSLVGRRGNTGPQGLPGSTFQNVFIQDTQPVTDMETYLWVETEAGAIKTFWVET